ncbi:Domain of uncharacterised function (DUF2825) [Serratia marcescens]|nr:Domain of uncharacterised function (DUF2825) [Serratia marcescens]
MFPYSIVIFAVYPRWRGEHDCSAYTISWTSRFIPAGAGNTATASSSARCCAVYPRWRGEHGCSTSSTTATNGLSPLARGTQPGSGKRIRRCRFIPAGAGNTRSSVETLALSPVYPRWRGEHIAFTNQLCSQHGLSPLARGTRPWWQGETDILRFIPAGAGNTRRRIPAPVPSPVYPRWRGEHSRRSSSG